MPGALALLAACSGGPAIERFTASSSTIPLGGKVTLSWTVRNADRVEISGVGEVRGSSMQVQPPEDATYVLTATNEDGVSRSEPLRIEVGAGFEVRGGSYHGGGGSLGTVLMLRFRDAHDAPQASDLEIALLPPSGTGAPLALACEAGRSACVALLPGMRPVEGIYTARTEVAGDVWQASFSISTDAPSPPSVLALRASDASVEASWSPVDGALRYRVEARPAEGTDSLGAAQWVDAGPTVLPTSPLGGPDVAVQVEAFNFDPEDPRPPVDGGPPWALRGIGFAPTPGSGWVLHGAAEYDADGTLSLEFPAVGSDEHIAVLPLNLTTKESVQAMLSASNTVSTAPAAPALVPHIGATTPSPHERVRAAERGVLSDLSRERPLLMARLAARKGGAPAQAPQTTSFCIAQGLLVGSRYVRKSASLRHETAHALFYVDSTDLPDFAPYEHPEVPDGEPTLWDTLGNFWESTIYPADTSTFGAESDVDGNAKLIVLFSDELGAAQNGAILLGYFWAGDIVYPADASSGCSGRSNGADVFYLNGIGNVLGSEPTAEQKEELFEGTYPDTLAHELQHLINFNQHFIVHEVPLDVGEETWINEGLSLLAEDLAGFGWNRASGRAVAARYLNRMDDEVLRYSKASLTLWESDPVGNYQGVHTFFRFFADRLGDASVGALARGSGLGIANLEERFAMPFEWAFASWVTALMFSNETFAPSDRFHFTGAAWTPLHQKIATLDEHGGVVRQGYLRYVPLGPDSTIARLRTNGFNAFLTTEPAVPGQSVTVRLQVFTDVRPHVVTVRFSGTLPPGEVVTP